MLHVPPGVLGFSASALVAFWAGSFSVAVTVPPMGGYIAASLGSTSQKHLPFGRDNQECLQTLPCAPWGVKSPPGENTALKKQLTYILACCWPGAVLNPPRT